MAATRSWLPDRVRRGLGRATRPARRRLRTRGSAAWKTGPPDFVGVGAQRCGTTWWWRLLSDHPQIQPPWAKELHYFDAYFERPFSDADIKAYHELFPRPAGSMTGEWTPRYMYDFWTPELLCRAAPDARILTLLRDPVARYQSGVSHELDRFRRGVRRGPRRQHAGTMIANDALARSLYGRQLAALYGQFDPARVLVLQYERCVADPRAELRRTYEFLGLEDPDYVPQALTRRSSWSHPQVRPPDTVTEIALRLIAEDVLELKALVPELDLGLWPSCRDGNGR